MSRTAFLCLAVAGLLTPDAAALDRSPADIYQRTLRSTAWVHGRHRQGTGWLADAARRLLVTNYHVVGTEESVTVIFPDFRDGKLVVESRYYRENETALARKGRAVRGQVIVADPKRDLALVRLASLPEDVTPLKLARHGPSPSDRVHSVGNPGAGDAFWVYTTGTVRQVYRNRFQYRDGQQVEAQVIETQTPLNPGDSGGPVVNDDGEVVGVNAAGRVGAQLVSLCIDAAEVRALMANVAEASHPLGQGNVPPLPRRPTAADHNNRGVDYYNLEQYDRALVEFNDALRLDPNYALAYKNRALTWLRMSMLSPGRARPFLYSALADYSAALQLNPKDADAYHGRGVVHSRLGDRDKALRDFTAAIQIDPNHADAYRSRSKLYYEEGEIEKGQKDLAKAIELRKK